MEDYGVGGMKFSSNPYVAILIHRHILKCFDTHKQNISTYTRLQLQNLQHSMLCFKLSITQCSTQLAKAMNRTEQNRTELTLPNCLANQSIQTSSKQNRTFVLNEK